MSKEKPTIAEWELWVRCDNVMPQDGQYVLVYPAYRSGAWPDEPRHVLKWREKHGWSYYLGGSVHSVYGEKQPTHWMPLPDGRRMKPNNLQHRTPPPRAVLETGTASEVWGGATRLLQPSVGASPTADRLCAAVEGSDDGY